MTNNTVALNAAGTNPLIDFTSPSTITYGTSGQRVAEAGVMALWPGDANRNGVVSYSGSNNDAYAILLAL